MANPEWDNYKPDDRPPCHVCGSKMINSWHCTSCGACTAPHTVETYKEEIHVIGTVVHKCPCGKCEITIHG